MNRSALSSHIPHAQSASAQCLPGALAKPPDSHDLQMDMTWLNQALGEQRTQLVGLCARLTENPENAEDLAQETLLEAWRALHKLRDADRLFPWLAAIARNVCLRWARQHGRELAHTTPMDGFANAPDEDAPLLSDTLADPDSDDLIIELERQELAALLDRTLALLPPETRLALIESVVYGTPQAEIAARLGLSEGALRVRLSRGRLALRQALSGDLRAEAESLGVALPTMQPSQTGWRTTRIWCPFCGRYPIECYLDRAAGEFAYRCVGRCQENGMILGWSGFPSDTLAEGLTSPKAILSRGVLTLGERYANGLAHGSTICPACQQRVPVHIYRPENPESAIYGEPDNLMRSYFAVCPQCGSPDSASLWHLMLDRPEAQRFWRAHPRMRVTPEHHIEVNNQPAVVASFEAIGSAARLDIITSRDTLITLGAYTTAGD